MPVTLSTFLDDPSAIPYLLWDEPMSVAELRRRLAGGSAEERLRMLAKVLREALDTDAWKFTTPKEVLQLWSGIQLQLGRRRIFGAFCCGAGKRRGYWMITRLGRLQEDFLGGFFRQEGRFFLTEGAALAGFYLGHRETPDLDLFVLENVLDDGAAKALESHASSARPLSPLSLRRTSAAC